MNLLLQIQDTSMTVSSSFLESGYVLFVLFFVISVGLLALALRKKSNQRDSRYDSFNPKRRPASNLISKNAQKDTRTVVEPERQSQTLRSSNSQNSTVEKKAIIAVPKEKKEAIRTASIPKEVVHHSSVNDLIPVVEKIEAQKAALLSLIETIVGVVDYSPKTRLYSYSLRKKFPVLKFPDLDVEVKDGFLNENIILGVTEKSFGEKLKSACGDMVIANRSFKLIDSDRVYTPDFLVRSGNFSLVIEIDEPYSGTTRKPTHYIDSHDVDRNHFFINAGYTVVRFAEEQVVKQSQNCIQLIIDLINEFGSKKADDLLKPNNWPDEVKLWTVEEASQMAKDNYREAYLGFQFNHRNEEASGVVEYDKHSIRKSKPILEHQEGLSFKERDNSKKVVLSNSSVSVKIQKAISSNKILGFSYQGSKGAVKPISIENGKLTGRVTLNNSKRSFGLQDITDLQLLSEDFYETSDSKNISLVIQRSINEQYVLEIDYAVDEHTVNEHNLTDVGYSVTYLSLIHI